MKFQTHNDNADLDNELRNVGWTLSTIQATKAQLTKAFGRPIEEMSDRVQYEWIIKFEDGTIATIYDWKKPEFGDDEVVTWNIGGNVVTGGQRAAGLVHNAFREAHGLHVHSLAA